MMHRLVRPGRFRFLRRLRGYALLSAVVLTLLPQVASAQNDSSNRGLMLGTTPFFCKSSGTCLTDVKVTRGQVNDTGGCTVTWAFNGYDVKQGKKPKLVWRIVTDPADPDTYKFHPNDGIRLNPADMNDPSKDLFDQGHDVANGTRFRWRDKNKRNREQSASHPIPEEREIRFDFVVLRVSDGHQCDARDPVIINRGE
jgi:hypothetical protein